MRSLWIPPDRPILRISELHPQVRPLYDPSANTASRQAGRSEALDFLRRWHYMHKIDGSRDPAMTWAFGLYLCGELSGVVVLNPPAAGVCQHLYGTDNEWRRRVISATRVCCTDDAPFGSESHMVSAVWRMLPRLDHRWSVGVAMSDLAVIDPLGRRHHGGIYAASNAWWAGTSTRGIWRGFRDPKTGARLSRKCGGRNRTKDELPDGWEIEGAPTLNRFLWFVGPDETTAREALQERVQVAARPGASPIWTRPREIARGTHRAYHLPDSDLMGGVARA